MLTPAQWNGIYCLLALFNFTGSLSTTPNSTRPNSPLEGISIPVTPEGSVSDEKLSQEGNLSDSMETPDLDVGNDIEGNDGTTSNIPSAQDQTTCKSSESEQLALEENAYDKDTIKETSISATDYSLPTKIAKIDTSATAVSSKFKQKKTAKVKAGTSLLLKRK